MRGCVGGSGSLDHGSNALSSKCGIVLHPVCAGRSCGHHRGVLFQIHLRAVLAVRLGHRPDHLRAHEGAGFRDPSHPDRSGHGGGSGVRGNRSRRISKNAVKEIRSVILNCADAQGRLSTGVLHKSTAPPSRYYFGEAPARLA